MSLSTGKGAGSQAPQWDGHPAGWIRYQSEVRWYVAGITAVDRIYEVGRLLPGLTGTVRQLVIKWDATDFEVADGWKIYLTRIGQSVLIKKALVDAVQRMDKFFDFKRGDRETVTSFLVRESAIYDEFLDAIQRLYQEKVQKEQAADKGKRDNQWWESTAPPKPWTATAAAAGDIWADEEDMEDKAPSVAPSHYRAEKSTLTFDLSVFDSFILDTLRGWRLLRSARLNPEERRDVLAATQNQTDFEHITNAIRDMIDDNSKPHGNSGGKGSANVTYAVDTDSWNTDSWTADSYYDDSGTSAWSSNDYNNYTVDGDGSWWEPAEDGGWWQGWQDEAYNANYTYHYAAAATVESEDGHADPEIAEMDQHVLAAESLAMEAQRTLTAAREHAANARKDRGFGKVMPSKSGGPCFGCGGPHQLRDCPDRHAPGSKGKGKFGHFQSKGKGKGKGFKGKGKGKHVNTMQLGTLNLDINATEQPTFTPDGKGLKDTGATASAGPEAAVQRLIAAVLQKDPGAQIVVDSSNASRPWFRYGNGQWEQALYRANLTSKQTGKLRKFLVYALPGAIDSQVPVFVGMSHLGCEGAGAITDLASGMLVYGLIAGDKPRLMERNSRGHFLIDIVDFLCGSSLQAPADKFSHANLHVIIQQDPDQQSTQTTTTSMKHVTFDQKYLGLYGLELCDNNCVPVQSVSANDVSSSMPVKFPKTINSLGNQSAFLSLWQSSLLAQINTVSSTATSTSHVVHQVHSHADPRHEEGRRCCGAQVSEDPVCNGRDGPRTQGQTPAGDAACSRQHPMAEYTKMNKEQLLDAALAFGLEVTRKATAGDLLIKLRSHLVFTGLLTPKEEPESEEEINENTIMGFGKFLLLTCLQVYQCEPGYVTWARNEIRMNVQNGKQLRDFVNWTYEWEMTKLKKEKAEVKKAQEKAKDEDKDKEWVKEELEELGPDEEMARDKKRKEVRSGSTARGSQKA